MENNKFISEVATANVKMLYARKKELKIIAELIPENEIFTQHVVKIGENQYLQHIGEETIPVANVALATVYKSASHARNMATHTGRVLAMDGKTQLEAKAAPFVEELDANINQIEAAINVLVDMM
jgi:hypothetical protein